MPVRLDSSYLLERDSAERCVEPPAIPFPDAGSAPEVPLEAYDNVLISPQPNFELHRTVTIQGEVYRAGTYAPRAMPIGWPMLVNDTTVHRDLVALAGALAQILLSTVAIIVMLRR